MRTDWREQELVIKPEYATERAQTAGVTREAIAHTLRFATDGVAAGIYRDDERLIPIIVRAPKDTEYGLIDHMTGSQSAGTLIPLGQVINGFNYEIQDTLYHRRGRVPTLTVSADIALDTTHAAVHPSTSRFRPVVLAAATTILGMIPLLGDAFFVSMAVTIMAGLAFGSVLTLIAAPVLYYVFFKRDEKSVPLSASASLA